MGTTVLKEGIEMLNDWDGPRDKPVVDNKQLLEHKIAELDRIVAEIKQILKELGE